MDKVIDGPMIQYMLQLDNPIKMQNKKKHQGRQIKSTYYYR
jgi:hypothetical protein